MTGTSRIDLAGGNGVRLRTVAEADGDRLIEIRSHPLLVETWLGSYGPAEFVEDLADDSKTMLAVVAGGAVVGMIQFAEETDPDYFHAGIDIYIDPARHRQGIGSEAIRMLCRYLFDERGHHRLTIDPAASNEAAIACYAKVGFVAVGRMRQYQRRLDGTFEDGLLMELLASDQ